MKHLLTVAFVFLMVFSANAQSSKEDLDMIQAMFGKQKKELVQAFMTIPEDKKADFWALYDEYENGRKELGRERVALIEDYANSYETLDDKKSADLMARKFKWNAEYMKFQKKYYDRMAKLIGGKQSAKFFQLEDYLENSIRLFLQDNIPFIDQLDKTKLKTSMEQ